MKDIEIHFDDGEYAERILLEEIERRSKKYWINAKGERVDISSMSDEYLMNCYNLVKREKALQEDRVWDGLTAEQMFYSD